MFIFNNFEPLTFILTIYVGYQLYSEIVKRIDSSKKKRLEQDELRKKYVREFIANYAEEMAYSECSVCDNGKIFMPSQFPKYILHLESLAGRNYIDNDCTIRHAYLCGYEKFKKDNFPQLTNEQIHERAFAVEEFLKGE